MDFGLCSGILQVGCMCAQRPVAAIKLQPLHLSERLLRRVATLVMRALVWGSGQARRFDQQVRDERLSGQAKVGWERS